jgi:xylan 1,4-beta-xylosidase
MTPIGADAPSRDMTGSAGRFRNPILPGSYPDPSICRVGPDYYLVTSSFEYFPGLPMHHSRDLVNWRPLGHVLTRPEQLNLDGIRASGGLYAPTIRYADGVFYVVCTLVDGVGPSGNFIVTATDPAGPWSDPSWVSGADGFDPSLLFDDDGRLWYCGTSESDPVGQPGRTTVWVQELDRGTLQLTGQRHDVWHGAMVDARWSEAPHLYRIGDAYYLFTAEGGTSFEHAVVVARSTTVTGPFEGCPRNPVLTARDLGHDAPIVATGHADIMQTADGEWWSVLLGVRDGENGLLGRETFLTSLSWDAEGWPLFNPGIGKALLEDHRPELPDAPWPSTPRCDSFDTETLAPTWMFVRTPREQWWSLTERPGHLRLRLRAATLADRANPSFVARRLQHQRFSAYTCVEMAPQTPGESAGLVVYHSGDHHYRFEVAGVDRRVVRLVQRIGGIDETVGQREIDGAQVLLGVEGDGSTLQFRVGQSGTWQVVANAAAHLLSASVAGGFFGVVVGLYATSSGAPSTSVADFDWFEYSGPAP